MCLEVARLGNTNHEPRITQANSALGYIGYQIDVALSHLVNATRAVSTLGCHKPFQRTAAF